jgi:hypothetical protein
MDYMEAEVASTAFGCTVPLFKPFGFFIETTETDQVVEH